MKAIKVDASMKQLSKLRNGHSVRVKPAIEGEGFNMLVDPAKFDTMTRCFTKGSAVQLKLSPDEIKANKDAAMSGEIEGQGIFTGGRIKMPSLKKVGKVLSDAGKKAGKEIVAAEKVVRKNPTARAIIKTGVPLAAELGTKAALQYAGADPATAKAVSTVVREGSKAGLGEVGYGLYAGASRGHGIMAGRALPGPPSRMPEVSSISIGGNLLARSNAALPPALQSDPMSANWHMNTQLLPQFQRGGIRFV